MLTLPPLGDMGVSAQSTLNTTFLTRARDDELQKTHIVLFNSPRDVMQVTTLSRQLGLGSELVYWYRDATSVPLGHMLIDLSPRTDDRLR